MKNSVKMAYQALFLTILLFPAFPFCLFAQPSSASAASGTTALFPLAEVRSGLRGKALTVFSGSKPEEFGVEILGVVPGAIGPRQDMIIGRLIGANTDRTAVFAGMSGSPVYIDGRLVGAISYSFPFSKEPICGITPIEQMLGIFETGPKIRRASEEPRSFSFAELAASGDILRLPQRQDNLGILAAAGNPMLSVVAGQSFRPIATPLTFSGFSQQTLDAFAPQLIASGFLPVAAVGGAAPITRLKPATESTLTGGTSVSMQLTRGDYSIAAAGTVTLRDGDKIYAFGHPFLNLGSSDLPMAESHVVTVIPNVNNSFKLAVPEAMVGAMTQDRATGVFGRLGKTPAMVPVVLKINTSRGGTESYNFEVAKDEVLTPLLLNITIYNSITAQERGFGESTVSISGKIAIKTRPEVNISRRFTGQQAIQLSAVSVAAPVAALLRSGFDECEIERIELEINSADGTRTGTLERLAVDRSRIKPGETIEVTAFARTNSGRVYIEKIPVRIPEQTPAGIINITVADGAQAQQSSAAQAFVPRDLTELIRIINGLRPADRLYLQITRTSAGAVIGAGELPNLPPSAIATINNERSVGFARPLVTSVISETVLPRSQFIISGKQSVTVEVVP